MKRFLLLLLLSVPVFLLAQSAMSLDDCIRLAYKQNPAVRNGVIGIKETKADYIASVDNEYNPRRRERSKSSQQ
jgi:hypothetical protein